MSTERWKHKKRGTIYEVIAQGKMQIDGDLDDEKMIVYRGPNGEVWVRPAYEFLDGRFERMEGGDCVTKMPDNAPLIAAAPELLAVLKEVIAVLRKEAPGTTLNNERFDSLGIRAYAAIAKAEGRS